MLEPKIVVDHLKLIRNVSKIKSRLNEGVKFMAVVKSDAYGYGMDKIAGTLDEYVDMFGVGYLEEGVKLRQSTNKKILVMGPIYDFGIAIQHNLTVTIESLYQYKALVRYLESYDDLEEKVQIHIKVDTGMHRFGLSEESFEILLNDFDNKQMGKWVVIEGVYSHFASTVKQNKKLVEQQYQSFQKMKGLVKRLYKEDVVFHIANSENACDSNLYQENMVRIGNGLYGGMYLNNPLNTERIGRILLPVVSIRKMEKTGKFGYGYKAKAKVGTRLGTVATGFYEGVSLEKMPIGYNVFDKIKMLIKRFARNLIKGDYVIYNERQLPIVGMVNMQFFQIDLSNTGVMIGEFIELNKEAIFYSSSVKREHILEDKNEITH